MGSSVSQSLRLEGYPSLAHFIARDAEAAIYRRYSHLSTRSLLYLQSELHGLESQLQDLDREDVKNRDDEEAQKAAREWRYFSGDQNSRARERKALLDKISSKVREYRAISLLRAPSLYRIGTDVDVQDKALLLENRVLALSRPSSRTLQAFKRWFGLTGVPVLWGRDEHIFDDTDDLIALGLEDTDRLNHMLKSYFGWFFQTRSHDFSNDSHGELFYYSSKRIQTAGAVISILASAALLVGAIVCLLLIVNHSIHLRVGMIVLFTCLFALVVGLLTNARRAEIFGATAA
ncbi:MAG: hypothetical protein Q9190_001899 [Brigantiaea leucoxantha]